MRNSRRFVAVAVLWALIASPAPTFAGPFGPNHYGCFSITQPLRQPKPGEHLGEYLIADRLPPRYALPPEPQRAPSVALLSPVPTRPATSILPPPALGATILKTGGVPIIPWANGIAPPGAVPLLPKVPDNRTSIRFTEPSGMKVAWQQPGGSFTESANALTAPKEHNFVQGKTYRLRLTHATKGEPDETLDATIEIAPTTSKTRTFLMYSSVPVTFVAGDFERAKAGQLVVKVIYLPDPAEQDFSTVVDAEEVVSTRLEPDTDPIKEAARRGTILAVVRLGNIDLEKR